LQKRREEAREQLVSLTLRHKSKAEVFFSTGEAQGANSRYEAWNSTEVDGYVIGRSGGDLFIGFEYYDNDRTPTSWFEARSELENLVNLLEYGKSIAI
jgi:hypothetical protein